MDEPARDERAATGRCVTAPMLGWGAALAVAVAVAVSSDRLVPGYLVEPTSLNVITLAVVFGVLATLGIVYRRVSRHLVCGALPTVRQVVAIAAMLWLAGYRVPVGVVAAGVQIAAFAGAAPDTRMLPLTITATHSDWWAQRGGLRVDARVSDSGAIVSLPVSPAGYDAARIGDRLVLPVETGRNGVRRIVLRHPIDPAELRRS